MDFDEEKLSSQISRMIRQNIYSYLYPATRNINDYCQMNVSSYTHHVISGNGIHINVYDCDNTDDLGIGDNDENVGNYGYGNHGDD